MQTLQPLNDRVIVKAAQEEKTSKGGIIIPDAAQERPVTGTVLAVGPGMVVRDTGERVAPGVSPGDKIVFGKYAGTEIMLDDERLIVLRAGDVYAKITEENSDAQSV